jgi:hypothetical protein
MKIVAKQPQERMQHENENKKIRSSLFKKNSLLELSLTQGIDNMTN